MFDRVTKNYGKVVIFSWQHSSIIVDFLLSYISTKLYQGEENKNKEVNGEENQI